jgi:hypothetical protein
MTDITVSDDLAARLADRLEHTDFESIDAYAEFVLAEVVTRVERERTDTGARESTASAEAVQSRLESLGYLEE